MTENKQVQIIIRVAPQPRRKVMITQEAKIKAFL